MQILMLIFFSSKNGISEVLWTAERWTKGRVGGKGAWGKDVQGRWLLLSQRRSDGQMPFRAERPSRQSLTWIAWWFLAPPGLSQSTHQTVIWSLLERARRIYWAGGQSYSSSLWWGRRWGPGMKLLLHATSLFQTWALLFLPPINFCNKLLTGKINRTMSPRVWSTYCLKKHKGNVNYTK